MGRIFSFKGENMKIILMLLALLFSTSVLAATNVYVLDIELSIKGEKISTSKLTVEEGKLGSITSETEKGTTSVEVVATEGEMMGEKGILLKFDFEITQNDGSLKKRLSPNLLVKNGQEAWIGMGEDERESPHSIIKVIATRKAI